MSHQIRQRGFDITDLAALKAALPSLGLQFFEGQTTARGYGAEQYRCVHAIGTPDGKGYQIGLQYAADGKTFTAAFDPFDGSIERLCGKGLGKLQQAYKSEALTLQLYREGYRVQSNIGADGKRYITATA